MFPQLTADCLDRWLADYDQFRPDFLLFCYTLSKACGYYPQVDFVSLKAAHAEWGARCNVWQAEYVMRDSDGLSHTKIMAILLYALSQVEWVAELEEFNPEGDRREGEYNGTPQEREESRRDINSGRGTFLTLQFVLAILNAFEEARDDRQQEFVFRLTHELEHDLMVYLLSERRDDMAIYLILESLYARDPRVTYG